MQTVEIDEARGWWRPALVVALSVCLGLVVFLAVAIVALIVLLIAYLTGADLVAVVAVALVVGALAGLGVTVFALVRGMQDKRYFGTTTLGTDGLTRTVGDFTATVPWEDVEWIGLVRKGVSDDIYVSTQPPMRLVAPVRRLQHRYGRLVKLYGGVPIASMKALDLGEDELRDRVAALSGGSHTLVRREPSVR